MTQAIYSSNRGAYGGTPGVACSPEGSEVGFLITSPGTGAVGSTSEPPRFAHYELRDYKYGVRQKSSLASASNVTVEGIAGSNFYRFWETTEGQETYNAVLRNSQITGFERAGVRWFSVKSGLVEDSLFRGLQGGAYITGVHLEGQCTGITIRRVTVEDVVDATTGGYAQGDGFSVEGGQTGIVLEDTRAVRCGDGGYDLKATDMDLRGTLHAEDCSRGFRFHRACRAETATLVVKAMRGRGLWWAGQTSGQYPDLPVMTIGKVIAMDPAGALSIFRFESGPADITVNALDIHKGWRGRKLQENGAGSAGTVKLPYGCRVEQDDGSWVTYPGAPPTGTGGVLL